MKKISDTNLCLLLLALLFLVAFSQTAKAQLGQTSSPYSRFGLGLLGNEAQGFNTAMSGLGVSLRGGNIANFTNPASYSAIDSLSFIVDAGMNVSFGNMKQGKVAINMRSAQFDYVTMGFRLRRKLGVSVGFMPYTRIGYSFEKRDVVVNDLEHNVDVVSYSSYGGEGGLHQVYAGVGWNPFDKFSVGVNVGFIWGTYSHTMLQTFDENGQSSSAFNPLMTQHEASLSSYNITLGAQYPIRLSQQNVLNVGATATMGHSISGNAVLTRNAGTSYTPTYTANSPFDLPWRVGVGVSLLHGTQWLVGVDAHYDRWSACHTPIWNNSDETFTASLGEYKDRTKVVAGAQFTPDAFSKNYLKRVQYRAGIHYSTPYLVINGEDGPREYGASVGVALPITNNYNNRSLLNVGFQWMQRSSNVAGLVKENYFMMNIGLTFNEMWFMKYKIK